MSGPLAGLRVLDITSVIMGPYATAILGDMGADVIKIEPPAGDIGRQLGPARNAGMSAITLNLQRNKRSLVIDRADPGHRARLQDLVTTCDVIVTNLRPGSRARLGLSWDDVHASNPRAILCTAQAFASDTDKGEDPAYDDVIQAVSGMSDIYRRASGEPRFSPSVLADKICGLVIVNSVLAALHSRGDHDEGQWVDVPMADTMLAFNLVEHLAGMSFEPAVGQLGWSRTLVEKRRPHRARDGWVCVMPYTDRNWADFFHIVGRAELAADPRFATSAARHRHNAELQEVLAEAIGRRTVEQWLTDCNGLDIAAEQVLDLERVDDDPYFRARHALIDAVHPTEGEYRIIRFPVDFSATPITEYRPAPRIGDTGSHPGWRPRPEQQQGGRRWTRQ